MISNKEILNAQVLIVDDQELSITMLREILFDAGYKNIASTTDSTKACKMYQKIKPAAIILDLNMPQLNGFQVMSQLKEIEGDNYLPILILSGEEEKETRFSALSSGAKDFLSKPYDRLEVLLRIRNIIETRLLHSAICDQNKILEDNVKLRTKELYDTQLDVIRLLARAVEYRDSETGMHIVRMSQYAQCLANAISLSRDECEMILTASPLHDIGKIAIPDNILRKPGKLTLVEWEIMKTHSAIGGELLSGSKDKFIKMGRDIALTHHEKWDGTGYPKGIKGRKIPLVGRISCLCDVFDALTSHRPYKKAWSIERSIEEIKKGSGNYFEPYLVKVFLKNLPKICKIKRKLS